MSLETTPVASGSSGRCGYSSIESVGRVNFAEPEVTNTRVPSSAIVIGLFGRERQISARSFPGTKTFPFTTISAVKCALLDVSKSDPDKKTSSPVASITIPSSSVLIGRVERLRETQLTPSVRPCWSTVNFISTVLASPHSFESLAHWAPFLNSHRHSSCVGLSALYKGSSSN